MKVSEPKTPLKFNYQNKTSFVDKLRKSVITKQCERKLPPLSTDTIELSADAKIALQANRIFSRSQKFSIRDYNSLSKLEKTVLRDASAHYKKHADDSLKVGLKVKEKLDKYYGEDNYVFCSIGTSPSGVARVLEFTGAQVRYFPISRLNWLFSVDDWKRYSDKFSNYQEFLNEQGLSREEVSKSGKNYLFYDFVQQGMSLMVFKKMMKEHFGLDLPNVSFNNVNYLCQSACAEKIDPPQYSIDYIETYMNGCAIEEVCGIPHLDIAEIDKIDECKNYENLQAKMFNFLIIDELSKRGLLKENPSNKIAL